MHRLNILLHHDKPFSREPEDVMDESSVLWVADRVEPFGSSRLLGPIP